MNFFLDAHEDLAYSMLSIGRDYTRSVAETRRHELNQDYMAYTEETLLGWPEYNQANVGIIFSTLFASPHRRHNPQHQDSQVYQTLQQAHDLYWNQLLHYHHISEDHPQTYRLIQTKTQLEGHINEWTDADKSQTLLKPVGLIPLMEGAEGILSVDELPDWWRMGVRIIGLAWAGNRFCGGTGEPGPLTQAGKDLLKGMAEVGFILDISHMDAQSAFEAVEIYPGKIIASHANPAALVRGYRPNRLLQDDLIRLLFQRDAVIGVVPFNNFLDALWNKQDGKDTISLDLVAQQLDYLCQIAGDAHHVGIGTDFDGGFGLESVPQEINSIADLPKLNDFLTRRGFAQSDLKNINSANFLHVIKSVLPEQ